MQVERFDPAADGAAVQICHQILLAAAPVDEPHYPPMSARAFAGLLALGWTEDPVRTWLARHPGGEPCGWYVLSLPERENRHLAGLHLLVHPSQRRAGVGVGLARHAATQAHHLGRTLLSADTSAGSAGAAFARALGAHAGITEVRRVLEVDAIPAGHLAALRAQAEPAARGYVVEVWAGDVPEEEFAALAALIADENDAPRDAGREPVHWDAERVRMDYQRVAAQGLRSYTVVARWRATGELAGLTQIGVDPGTPDWAFQELTVVARRHRGHRLGLLVKAAMLELLAEREPQLTRILTGNAAANEHMIAINAALGFQPLDRWLSWELPIAALTAPSVPAQS